jgi:hypothetical protein
MKKLHELGAKTGLSAAEVNKVAKFGLLGLLALGIASLTACFKTQKAPAQVSDDKPQTLQDLANSVNTSTSPAKAQDKNCGPYPGYPCGTRYYTVSAADFRRLA